jgi:two-component sensor histidine kinase
VRVVVVVGALERWRTKRKWGFGFAVIAFLGAFALRYALDDWLPPGLPFLTFFPAIILTAFFTGLWPTVLLAFLSALAAWYFFLPPVQSFDLNPAAVFALGFFAVVATIMIILIHALNVAIDRLRDERARARILAQQRETMFTELQHRISNNLQLVAALLNLETGNVADQSAKKALDEASKRLALIGKLHRNLYDPEGAEIDFGVFLKTLCDDVVSAWNARNVDCLVKSIRMTLPPEQSIPIALIATELMSNSLEHGLKGRPHGKINVDVRRDGADTIILEVADDGNGLPPGFDVAMAKSLGLNIVQILTKQIDGRFEIQGGSGTTCRIVIPERKRPANATEMLS